MSNIVRWNPLREMANMQSAMDRIFEQTWRPFFDDGEFTGVNNLALDVHEDDKNYMVSTELPGVAAENIHVKLDGDYLVIEGEIPEHEVEKEGTRPLMKERRYGHYSRRVRLLQAVNSEKIEATYKDGVLSLTLPKREVAQPKMIPVKTTNGQK
jgi:HSP20 family protein